MITLSYSQAAFYLLIVLVLAFLATWYRLTNQALRRHNKAFRQMLRSPGIDWQAEIRRYVAEKQALQKAQEEPQA